MPPSDDEKNKKWEDKDEAGEVAPGVERSMARLSTEEGSGVRVIERVVHGGGGGAPPMMLTRTNYSDWAMITKLQRSEERRVGKEC